MRVTEISVCVKETTHRQPRARSTDSLTYQYAGGLAARLDLTLSQSQ